MSSIRVISRQDIETHLSMQDAVKAVEQAYVLNAEKGVVLFDTVFHDFEEGKADMDIKSGSIDKASVFGFKLMSWFGDNAAKGLPTLMGTIMLFDRATGAPLVLLDGASITGMRTGAAGAIGTKYLARPESTELLIVGAGNQAPFQLAAHLMLMDTIKTVRIYDPLSYEASVAFCEGIKDMLTTRFLPAFTDDPSVHARLQKKYSVDFIPVKKVQEAVGSADIIVTATPSRKPLIMRDWLKPGTHLSCMGADMAGKQEIDGTIFAAARVFVDDIEKTSKIGEMEIPIKDGLFSKNDIICEIGQVIAGRNPGRLSETETTVFDATGLAAQDILSARELMNKAAKLGFGTIAAI
jgi:ornithine cyclodeaminase/alanine dehydrogenase